MGKTSKHRYNNEIRKLIVVILSTNNIMKEKKDISTLLIN